MTEVAKIRERTLPIVSVVNGKQRLQGGRWNVHRVAEYLDVELGVRKTGWITLDDLARFVYGTTGPKNRDNVRKHIPAQRRFMLHERQTPFVTKYGPRGTILEIKMYSSANEETRALLGIELTRAKERKEISEQRCADLERTFYLSSPAPEVQ